MSFLNRRDELTVPSCPFESIITDMASPIPVGTPRMFPIKQLLLMFAPLTWEPIQMVLLAVVMALPAPKPKATFWTPVVLFRRAFSPIAVLAPPAELFRSA